MQFIHRVYLEILVLLLVVLISHSKEKRITIQLHMCEQKCSKCAETEKLSLGIFKSERKG